MPGKYIPFVSISYESRFFCRYIIFICSEKFLWVLFFGRFFTDPRGHSERTDDESIKFSKAKKAKSKLILIWELHHTVRWWRISFTCSLRYHLTYLFQAKEILWMFRVGVLMDFGKIDPMQISFLMLLIYDTNILKFMGSGVSGTWYF